MANQVVLASVKDRKHLPFKFGVATGSGIAENVISSTEEYSARKLAALWIANAGLVGGIGFVFR
jgi:hypothetical protein